MNNIPTVNKCCFCVNLQLASTFIGCTETFSSFIALTHDIYLLSVDPRIARNMRLLKSGIASDTLISALQMAFGVGLILAIKEKNAKFIRLWILVHIFLYIVSIFNYVITSFAVPCCGGIANVNLFERLMALYSFRNFILYGYCIIIVNSYYGHVLNEYKEDTETGK